jgi:hypothetical protein
MMMTGKVRIPFTSIANLKSPQVQKKLRVYEAEEVIEYLPKYKEMIEYFLYTESECEK